MALYREKNKSQKETDRYVVTFRLNFNNQKDRQIIEKLSELDSDEFRPWIVDRLSKNTNNRD